MCAMCVSFLCEQYCEFVAVILTMILYLTHLVCN